MKKINLRGNERILVVRTDRIGDVILSLPTLELIKKNYPNCHLAMLVSPYTQSLLENNPYVDEVIVDDKKSRFGGISGLYRLAKFLRKKGFDVSILLHPSWRLACLLYLAEIRYRVGTAYRLYSFFFNSRVFQHRKTIEKHEIEYNLDMLLPLGISAEKTLPKVYLLPDEEEKGRALLKEFGIGLDDLVVVIHPGSGDSSLNFPARKFGGLADMLVEKERAIVVLTGKREESDLANTVAKNMKTNPINLVGKLELRGLASVLRRADLMISNSTGPMHLATSLGTPVVAIFCPIKVAGPGRWGPYGGNHQVILPPVPLCRKCDTERCRYYNCMDRIDTQEVYLKAKSILSSRKGFE